MEEAINSTSIDFCFDALNMFCEALYFTYNGACILCQRGKELTIELAKEIVNKHVNLSFRTKRSLELDDLTKRKTVALLASRFSN